MKLYSPPMITSKGEPKLGQFINSIVLDTINRSNDERNISTESFNIAFNHQGKRYDQEGELERVLLSNEADFLDVFNRMKIRSPLGIYRDNNPVSRENAKLAFKRIHEKGFIVYCNGQHFLDMDKIYKSTGIKEFIESLNTSPNGLKNSLLEFLDNINKYFPITKIRNFATPLPNNQYSSLKINPIFDIGLSPRILSEDPVDYCVDGSRTIFRGTFLPMVFWAAAYNLPFTRNVLVHGSLSDNEKNFKNLNEIDSNLPRFASLLASSSYEDTQIDSSKIRLMNKSLSKIKNLYKLSQLESWNLELFNEDINLNPLNLGQHINELIEGPIELSRHVSQNRSDPEIPRRINYILQLSKFMLPDFYKSLNGKGN